jgi:transposase
MPGLPPSVVDPLWRQFESLIPPVQDAHPLGCHRPRVSGRVVFDRFLARLVLGGSYQKHADATV